MTLTHPSPNFGKRPAGTIPRLVVLHADAGASDAGTISWLQSPESGVSYHALIGRQGGVFTFVDYADRAWHAGKSSWQGVPDCNDYSIGLAFANKHDGLEPLTPIQIAVMQAVVQSVRQLYPNIEVCTHADVSPGRKTDPLHSPGFNIGDYRSYP